MYQIDNSTAVASIPASTAAGTAGFFTDGNPATGVPATIMPAEYQNMLMMEIINVLTAAGITPSKSNFTQLLAAIKAVNRQGVILTDTGTANAYTAVNAPSLTALPATGYTQRINIANANTSASTFAPDGLAAKPVYGLGLQPLQGGELPAGVAVLMYLVQAGVNSGNGAWIILESLGGASQVAPATKSLHAMQLGQATGRLLRTTVYIKIVGVQNVFVDSAGGTTTGATSFNPLSTATKWRMRVLAGGGGGGGAGAASSSQVSCGTGGGGGGYAEGIYTGVSGSQTVAVGSGGAGGIGAAVGASGGTSSVGAILSAVGGGGGNYGVSAATCFTSPALGGTSSGGVVSSQGGGSLSAISYFSNGCAVASGGGGSAMGPSSAGSLTVTSTAGQSGGLGGGGGGAAAFSSGAANNGGVGGSGIVIIEEYA